ncbi:plasmid partitioning protein RepB [Phaeobacter italicus]|jgi:ParB family chromosome partitioning protein|uniref:plasmid partitioning protein RepB n=1 Tax=Phaeobacter italicus TaxID=481446 RepID=UPI002FD93EFA
MARNRLNAYDALAAGQGAKPKTHFPVLDVLESSLSAIRDIDPELIDDWGPVDRMGEGETAVSPAAGDNTFESLKNNIAAIGQQVPILVRPSTNHKERFEIIFGRRRWRACRELGIAVKANVQALDDQTALLAKAVENANRRELSFYEKALFADGIAKQYSTANEIGEALGVSRHTVQHLKKVTSAVPKEVGYLIGPAPNRGRRQWFQLVEAFTNGGATKQRAMAFLESVGELTSDERLDALISELAAKAKPQSASREPIKGVTVKAGQGVSMKVSKGPFADWLNDHLDDLLTRAHEEFKATSNTED